MAADVGTVASTSANRPLKIDQATGSTEFFALIERASRFAGVSLAEVFAKAELTLELLENPGTRVPIHRVRNAWRALEALAKEPLLGLKLSAHLEPGAFDILDYLVQSAGTLREASELFVKYLPLLADAGRVWLAESGENAFLCHQADGGLPGVSELVMGGIVARARLICGPSLLVRSVGFAHAARATPAEYVSILGTSTLFNQICDTVRFDRAALDAPTLNADPQLAKILRRQAELAVSRLAASPKDTEEELRELTLELVLSGHASLERMAERLGTTSRTLQRRLAELGLTHRRLVESVRTDLVENALMRGDQKWGELARTLGYSTPGSLRRARERWQKRHSEE
jgi:AraC-like DNA-binding protein